MPGSHVSRTYSPCGGVVESAVTGRASKPVPPCGSRTNRLVIDAVRCEPGKNDKAPLCGVHLSNAIQKPTAEGGFVYYLCYQSDNRQH